MAATLLAVLVVVRLTSLEEARLEQFGNATARALAELAVEPLLQQDRLHLGVIGNRMAELDTVTGVASYSPDNELLASTGSLDGARFSQPVTLDDSLVGYVRVSVDPAAFHAVSRWRYPLLALAGLLLPFAIGAGFALARAAREGRLGPAATPAVDDSGPEETAPPPPAGDVRHYLLAVNLYNQLTLPADQREFELSLCLELAEAVADVYQGQVVTLPGIGVLLDLDHTDDPDRPFQILCAAFLLLRLLQEEAPFGRYRLGLHVLEQPAEETLALDHEAVADAALLSALARDGTVAASASLAVLLDNTARLRSRPLVNPLLDELATSGPNCRLVTDLESPFSELVFRQSEQLQAQREATSSPSTF